MIMQDLSNLLNDLIANEYQLKINKGILKLTETKPEASCKFVNIQVAEPAFAFTLDKDKKIILPFKREADFINKVNDGVLICKKGSEFICFLIELKSSKDSDYIHQLKSGRNFVRYLLLQIADFYELNVQLKFFGLLFREGRSSTNKKPFKRGGNNFKDSHGLKVATLPGNQSFQLAYLKRHLPAND